MQAVENYQRKKIEEVSNTAPICVLHVDDDPSILEISKQILVDMGNFDIDHASCVEEAFKKLASGHYDVVISDYEMPQKDGLQFLKELRKQNNEIPFILFTGKGREEVAIKTLNLGADGYINKQGDPETVYGELTHEIAQLANQNRFKLELAEGEDRFRHFFTNIPNAVVVYEVVEDGEDFVLMDINFAAGKIEHISKAHVIGKRVTAVFPGAKEFGVLEVFKRVWKTGQSEYFPAAFYHDKRDSGSWRENWIFKLPNSNIVDIYRDITERVKAELELKQSNEALERVAESIDSGLAVIGRDYEVVWANKRLMDLGVASNKKCYQTFNQSKTICPDCGVKKIFEQNVSLDVHEYKTVNSKGETVWVELRVTPLKDKNGNVTAALELAVPITERKKVEEKIQFQADLLNRIGQAIIMVDNNRTIRYWNNAAEKLYGWPEKQALGRKVIEILGGTSQEEASEITKRLMAGESWSTEVLAKNKDGSFVPIIVNRSPIFNQDGAFVGAASIATDITLQKNAEADLTFALNSFSNSLDKIQELNEKLRVVGSLTRHDVRNKLSVVTGYAYLLNKKHAEEADIV
ncbi:PAS domain-containing protein, partial [Candidatus Bathyarchaeota archaeon]|nr:PAS domain-containing protein [Candidatus Bathyarchaeota archaeon]